ncbi:MAG: DUF2339 domain-containing protein [Chlorobiaceae bacterium]
MFIIPTIIWIISFILTGYLAEQRKLNVGMFLVLSFFTGPLAVLIILLTSTKQSIPAKEIPAEKTLHSAATQLQNIQQELKILARKTQELESLILTLSNESIKQDIADTKRGEPIEEQIEHPLLQTSKPQPLAPPDSTKDQSDIELDFGRNWLNKIGITILALGIAFLISYSFKFFGPALKIAFGYIIGAALFQIGVKLEAKEKLMNYGRALLGGAWAIIYFTTYAMHHFDASRIIASPVVDSVLLGIVVAGMITHVLKYKSENLMAVVLVVAYLTSTTGQITGFTILSLLFISAFALYLVYRFQWVKTVSLGIILTYGIHFIWVMPHLLAAEKSGIPVWITGVNYYDVMNLVFLSSYWAVFLTGVHIVRNVNDPYSKKILAASNFGNIAIYSVWAYSLILNVFPDYTFELLLLMGAIYGALAVFMKKTGHDTMYISDIVAAVFAFTFSISLKFLPTTMLVAWLVEIPFLLFIGVNFRERIFRILSYTLTIIVAIRIMFLGDLPSITFFGLEWSWYGFICFWASISMAVCFYLTQRMKKEAEIHSDTLDISADRLFSLLSSLSLTLWVYSLIDQPWIAFALFTLALLLAGATLVLQLSRFRVYAYIVMAFGSLTFFWEPITTSYFLLKWCIIGFNVLSVFTLYGIIKHIKESNAEKLFFEYEAEMVFAAGIFLLVTAIFQYVVTPWISLGLGISSVFVIMTGFIDENKSERMGGMVLLALTVGRVAFVDLSDLDIIFKIITFIILGMLFLGISYIYSRFTIKKNQADC